jgi:hypothetical protein
VSPVDLCIIPGVTIFPSAVPRAKLIAPDSSHWSKWIDALGSSEDVRRARAINMHRDLLERGLVPLLTWHHLEELLGVEDDRTAARRVEFLQELPLVGWIRLEGDDVGLGSIAQVLAAEVIAACEGCMTLADVRSRARELLLRFGTGEQAVGSEGGVWKVVRPALRARKRRSDAVAALSPLRTFDDRKTIAELSKCRVNEPAGMRAQLQRIHEAAFAQALAATGGDAASAEEMAGSFIQEVLELLPPPGTSVRHLLVSTLVAQGLDEDEIRDECVLAELNELALFRSHLRVVAPLTGRPFDALKCVPRAILPSHLITTALKKHGQQRSRRSGSDLTDSYLGVLAAYCDLLFVDKRTAEDFRRALRNEPMLSSLPLARVAKGKDFTDLVADQGG